MITISGRGVNANFHESISQIRRIGEKQNSRAGEVMVAPYPVVTITHFPRARVLLCPERDSNPFFHLYEALWMLSGSRDANLLDHFVKTFSSRFSNEDGIQHGAYGYRWRIHFDIDQLEETIQRLARDPLDRRVVISMWDPHADYNGDNVTLGAQRDVPCNTQMYVRIVNNKLTLTVCCRSNDIIWGAMGSNIVHFSVVQEWLAARLGCELGPLYQLSNNWHAYVDVLDKQRQSQSFADADFMEKAPLCSSDDAVLFQFDCEDLVAGADTEAQFRTTWFKNTLVPMLQAHSYFKEGDLQQARLRAMQVQSADWSRAAKEWIERRMK